MATTSSTRTTESRPTGAKSAKAGLPRQRQRRKGVDAAGPPVAQFLSTAGTLTLKQRKLVVDQALLLLEQHYVHLPLKAAMHAVNPVQRLRLVRARLDRVADGAMEPEWQFHREMSSIFHSVRDLHTNYLLPAPFAGQVAFLPFQLEKCHTDGADHYLVSRTVVGFTAEQFGAGAEVTHWNGVPIARAVALNGAQFAGSNPTANLARGLDSLTLRPLVIQLPPDEDWVSVGYLGLDGQPRELREQWQIATNLPPMTDLDAVSTVSVSMAMDLDADEKSRARKLLYLPDVVELEDGVSSAALDDPAAVGAADLPTTMPGVFRARVVDTDHGTFGHLRIFTFSVSDPIAFRDEFVRLAGELPQNGLMVDVRDNGGGHLHAAEFTLQALTPRQITPQPSQFICTPLNLRICGRHRENTAGIDLGPWYESLEQAIETGAVYSAARPITPEVGANEIGQTYQGPVLLITDARCYSATDSFAAGFADHRIGPILGIDDTTGAGGANVWTHGLLRQLLQVPSPADTDSPYKALPAGANLRVAIRRTLRVGDRSGTPVEDLGVTPDSVHRMTKADVLSGNVDLLNAAAQLLAGIPLRRLDATTSVAGTTLSVTLDTAGVDRVDVYVDGHPAASTAITGAGTVVAVENASAATTVRLEGFAGEELVVARTLRL